MFGTMFEGGKLINMEDYIDWTFVQSIFSGRELYMNFDTRRKQIYCVSYFLVAALIFVVSFQLSTEIGSGLEKYIRFTLLGLAVILYGTEPFVLILQTLVFQHPAVDLNSLGQEDTSQIALVISCHKSADVIVRTCEGRWYPPRRRRRPPGRTRVLASIAVESHFFLLWFWDFCDSIHKQTHPHSCHEAFATRTNFCHGQCHLFGSPG